MLNHPPFHAVLLVEDDAVVRQCIVRMLQPHNVVAVGSVADAMKLFHEGSDFQAVISDFQLKNGDGLTLYKWIRRRSSVPFLLISGSIPTVEETTDLAFLPKPFKADMLQSKLAGLIDQSPVLAS